VKEVGFYLNKSAGRIEHWSRISDWNAPMLGYAPSSGDLVQDGFISYLHTEDMDQLCDIIAVWQRSITANGWS
jgi:hypothetical protein